MLRPLPARVFRPKIFSRLALEGAKRRASHDGCTVRGVTAIASEKVLVVGAGGVSRFWFEAIAAEDLEVAAVVDCDLGKAEVQRRTYCPGAVVSSDLKTMLDQVRPDFVIDLTPPQARAAVTGTALAAGFHVLCEKPLADSVATAGEIIKAADRSGRMCMVSQSRRWDVGPATVRQAMRSGVVGALTSVHCDFFLGAHFGDCRLTDPDSPEEGYALATTMGRRTMPSPLIGDMAVHHFDMARFMTGLDPVNVYAREFNPAGSWYEGACSAICIFEMTGGAIFSYRGSWSAEGFTTGWNGNWRLVGENGTILYENNGLPKAQVVVGGEGFRRPLRDVDLAPAHVPYLGMRGALREMLAFLRTGETPQTPCHDNIRSNSMVAAALSSSRTDRRLPVIVA
jgi:predicted dehydrogenase